MRPERLELEGFVAFRQPTTVNFAGADLFALVGATGAGKSSLIDAMIFALFGSVPRYGDRRLVAPIINQQAVEARVAFTFSVAGVRHVAVRVVRSQTGGGATTKEARLERLGPNEEVEEVLAGDADGVTAAVEKLLGLAYEHFTTCVVLPQGEFARFLHHKPRDRQALLIELLDLGVYREMAHQAAEHAAVAKERRAMTQARRAELGDPSAARVAELDALFVALGDLVEACTSAQDELDRLAAERRSVEAEALAAKTEAVRLAAVVAPANVTELAGSIAAASAAESHAAEQVTVMEAAVGDAEQVIAALEPPAILAARLALFEELARQRQLSQRGGAAVRVAEQALSAATELLRRSAETAREAAQRFDVVRQQCLAATLAADLAAGQDCPVCGQLITDLPQHRVADVVAAQRQLKDALGAQQQADKGARSAGDELLRVEEKLVAVHARVEEIAGGLEGGETVEQVQVQLAASELAARVLRDARSRLADARQQFAAAQRQRQGATEAELQARVTLDSVRDALAAFGPPPLRRLDLLQDWAALVQWAATRRSEAETASQAAEANRQRLDELAADFLASLETTARALGVAPGRDRLRDRVVAARVQAEGERDKIRADLARLDELAADLAKYSEAEQVASTLARHLQSNGFQKWLLDEALLRLVAGASTTLQQLSSGAYSMGLDRKTGSFTVTDHHNADAVRSVRTLSGGETFLASLALALSLANQVVELAAGGAAHLDAIFLDEGFGTLDPETLDVVAGAIEELGSQGRMVGVVSHVRELADRLPVRFEVVKGPAGSTVTRRED